MKRSSLFFSFFLHFVAFASPLCLLQSVILPPSERHSASFMVPVSQLCGTEVPFVRYRDACLVIAASSQQ